MYLPTESSKLFCVEVIPDTEMLSESRVFPYLEQLVRNYGIVNVYKAVDSIESFEESLNILLYEDRNFKDYDLLYFICGGSENNLLINGYSYSLEEIAELFEGKLKNKIIHFANSKALNIDTETSQYFLDVTGAKALSGYMHTSFVSSAILDMHFFGLYETYDDIIDLVEKLHEKHYGLCNQLGFHLFY